MRTLESRLIPIPIVTIKDQFRFWNLCDRKDVDDCWNWTGYKCPKGYGRFNLRGKIYIATRVSYKFHYRDPGKLLVLHDCNNTPCVNPKHLFLGDGFDNQQQCVLDGRKNLKGDLHNKSILSENDVVMIRARVADGETIASLSRELGVSYGTVAHANNGTNWSHI